MRGGADGVHRSGRRRADERLVDSGAGSCQRLEDPERQVDVTRARRQRGATSPTTHTFVPLRSRCEPASHPYTEASEAATRVTDPPAQRGNVHPQMRRGDEVRGRVGRPDPGDSEHEVWMLVEGGFSTSWIMHSAMTTLVTYACCCGVKHRSRAGFGPPNTEAMHARSAGVSFSGADGGVDGLAADGERRHDRRHGSGFVDGLELQRTYDVANPMASSHVAHGGRWEGHEDAGDDEDVKKVDPARPVWQGRRTPTRGAPVAGSPGDCRRSPAHRDQRGPPLEPRTLESRTQRPPTAWLRESSRRYGSPRRPQRTQCRLLRSGKPWRDPDDVDDERHPDRGPRGLRSRTPVLVPQLPGDRAPPYRSLVAPPRRWRLTQARSGTAQGYASEPSWRAIRSPRPAR